MFLENSKQFLDMVNNPNSSRRMVNNPLDKTIQTRELASNSIAFVITFFSIGSIYFTNRPAIDDTLGDYDVGLRITPVCLVYQLLNLSLVVDRMLFIRNTTYLKPVLATSMLYSILYTSLNSGEHLMLDRRATTPTLETICFA